jgi:hypothetical protein
MTNGLKDKVIATQATDALKLMLVYKYDPKTI